MSNSTTSGSRLNTIFTMSVPVLRFADHLVAESFSRVSFRNWRIVGSSSTTTILRTGKVATAFPMVPTFLQGFG